MHRPIGVTILALLSAMLGGLGLGEGMGPITPPVTEHFAAPISGRSWLPSGSWLAVAASHLLTEPGVSDDGPGRLAQSSW